MKLPLRICISLISAAAFSGPVTAQSFNQSFRLASPAAELEVNSTRGEIKVIAGEGNVVKVKAKEKDGNPKIKAEQVSPGRVQVEVSGKGKVKLEIIVPPSSSLHLNCYDCNITVRGITGAVRAVNAEGEIQLTNVRSPRVEAHSTSGSIAFHGEVLPSGSYTLKSFSGRVSVELPANLDCHLSAASFRGGIGLGDFDWRFKKQTDKLVEATIGEGRAALNLWTQEGTIQVMRKQ
ncbi:MAG: DUF4097 family beta strand repeat protein [Acidobacteria bacterium]|nr:DUF4097 family beta strand repeat protein [Acidobacteriota bacterium]MCW5967844.1 DUF4097 family beta strand repeat protein [Blastocatellales bacterium]